MKISKAALRRVGIGLALVLAVNAIVFGLLTRAALGPLQNFADDYFMTQAAGKQPVGFISIAALDERSVEAYGRDPSGWDRRHFADAIRHMKDAGVTVAAFDLPFAQPGPNDQDMAAAIDYAMHPKDGSQPMLVILAIEGDGTPAHVAAKGLEFSSFQPLDPALAAAKPIVAGINVDPDGDVVRSLPLLYYSGQQQILPLPLLAASAFSARIPGFTDALEFEDQPYRLHFGPYQIPIDQYFRMPIYFFTEPVGFAQVKQAYSFADVAEGRVPPELLKNRLVLIGPYQATGLADDYPVPTSVRGAAKMDSVEIWANAAQSLILGKFITPQSLPSTVGFMLGLSLLAALVFLRWGAFGWLATILLGAAYSFAEFVLTAGQMARPTSIGQQQTIELPNFAYVVSALALSSLVLFVYLFVQERRRRSAVYSTFGRYVTPAVAKQISGMQAAGSLNLGGTRRVATIMFGNLYLPAGINADDMLRLLNRYFDGVVRQVNVNGGTVNKFIGDHIMVLFNVPVDLDDHAAAACRTAYEALDWIKQERQKLPGQEATFGVGINTGPLVAGNMGSHNRMEYTVLGDTVNTASRLSGVAAHDEVIVSQAVVDQLDGSGAKLEDRGAVRVKGKKEPVRVYALLGFGAPGPVQILAQASVAAG